MPPVVLCFDPYQHPHTNEKQKDSKDTFQPEIGDQGCQSRPGPGADYYARSQPAGQIPAHPVAPMMGIGRGRAGADDGRQ